MSHIVMTSVDAEKARRMFHDNRMPFDTIARKLSPKTGKPYNANSVREAIHGVTKKHR